MYVRVNVLWIIIAFIVVFAMLQQCGGERIVRETVDVKRIEDSIRDVVVKSVKPVTVTETEWLKPDDSIVYKDRVVYKNKVVYRDTTIYKESEPIDANEYELELKSNDATADLTVLTTGMLLDIEGVITYPEKTITREVNTSRLFIYGSLPINRNFNNIEIGLMYNIKNAIQIGVGGQYSNLTNRIEPRAKIAIGI